MSDLNYWEYLLKIHWVIGPSQFERAMDEIKHSWRMCGAVGG